MISDPDSPCYLSPQGQYQRGRGQRNISWCRRLRRFPKISLVLVCVLLSAATVPLAAAQKTAAAHVERGYELLAQARREIQDRRRDQLLVAASKAFSHAYQLAGPRTKAQVLIGAAQGYLLMQRPPRVFPFLWSAPPLQRAEKNLQQALVLHPQNSAAALLMGVVLWRQAEATASQRHEKQQRSAQYFSRAAQLGMPIQLSAHARRAASTSLPQFSVNDTIVVLRYVDARRTGRPQDVLLCYRRRDKAAHSYGVVVSAARAYPLIADRATGAMARTVGVDDCKLVIEPDGRAVIAAVFGRAGRRVAERFAWDGKRFVFLGERFQPPEVQPHR